MTTEVWYVTVSGRGLDNSQIIEPIVGQLQPNPYQAEAVSRRLRARWTMDNDIEEQRRIAAEQDHQFMAHMRLLDGGIISAQTVAADVQEGQITREAITAAVRLIREQTEHAVSPGMGVVLDAAAVDLVPVVDQPPVLPTSQQTFSEAELEEFLNATGARATQVNLQDIFTQGMLDTLSENLKSMTEAAYVAEQERHRLRRMRRIDLPDPPENSP